MIGKLFFGALFRFRNLFILILAFVAAFFPLGINWALVVSLGIYLVLVIQSLVSKKFQEKFSFKQKEKQLQQLNETCTRLSYEAKKYLSSSYYTKLRKVMDDKNDILNSFMRGGQTFLKEKIVTQTLNLVISYLKLLTNFSKRNKELSSMDVTEIAGRITANNQRLSANLDPQVAEDIKKAVEMDERIIARLKDEKQELERISAKLEYMESTIGMFKQQILSSVESEDMVEKLETAINEATALDNVLEQRRKSKLGI